MNADIFINKAEEINNIIYSFLPEKSKYNQLIVDAMNYSVQAGGKRLRPLLMMESYRAFSGGKDSKALYTFMAAIECIHTYSLCHDDLPAMDNDQFRRGKLTTHAKFGEAFGILAGDGLLNYAFEIISNELVTLSGAELENGVKALKVLAEKAGYSGMVGGQTLDVYLDKNQEYEQKFEYIEYIYENKTAALLEASIMIGAILAGASDDEVNKLEKAGSKVGYAFQIKDDILDLTSSLDVIGKEVLSDEKNGKKTYVSFRGLEESEKDAQNLVDEALDLLRNIPKNTDNLELIFKYLTDRKY